MGETATLLMSLEEYLDFVTREIWPGSRRRSNARKVCNRCESEANTHGKHAPFLPVDYKGDCPRCGGKLRNTTGGF
jgi:uncharacterized paraquat-inducible protein A